MIQEADGPGIDWKKKHQIIYDYFNFVYTGVIEKINCLLFWIIFVYLNYVCNGQRKQKWTNSYHDILSLVIDIKYNQLYTS